MPVSKKIHIGEHRLGAQFLELRDTLQLPKYRRHLEKRLAFWITRTDRRLPIALLGRTLKEILDIPLVELMQLPSIGEKKFAALISLLQRVAGTSETDIPVLDQSQSAAATSILRMEDQNSGSWANLSEFEWNHWQKAVLDQGLAHEKLGRLCDSLSNLPKVLWNKPLDTYCRVSLDELRAMKTHGEKRIYAILKLFHDIYEVSSNFKNVPHLRINMSLYWAGEVKNWLRRTLAMSTLPPKDEVLENLISPLLGQLRRDASQSVVLLAESRLGIDGPISSVRQVAKDMNLARARVYQLMNEISDIMFVRWPEGGPLVGKLRDRCIHEVIDSRDSSLHEQFIAAAELFYPAGKTSVDYSDDEMHDLY